MNTKKFSLACLVFLTYSAFGAELRTVLPNSEFVTEAKKFFKDLKNQLKLNLEEQKKTALLQDEQKQKQLEKEFMHLIGKKPNSQNKLEHIIEHLGVFQAFIRQLHKINQEPSPEQLEFIKNSNLAFQASFNSTTNIEMKLDELEQKKLKTKRACHQCIQAIKEFGAIIKTSEGPQLSIPAEILLHARDRHSPAKARGGDSPRLKIDSPRASPPRDRSNTVAL